MRGANDVPWVTDPDGAITKSGPRKGLPKACQYGSPSNRAKQIENTTNLVKWGERRVVLGIGHALADTSGDGYNLTTACFDLTKLDVDSDEYKTLADGVIIRAKDLAKAMLAADRGTHGHALTEDHDEGRDWVTRAEAGEVLGLDAELQQALVAAWRQMLADTGLGSSPSKPPASTTRGGSPAPSTASPAPRGRCDSFGRRARSSTCPPAPCWCST